MNTPREGPRSRNRRRRTEASPPRAAPTGSPRDSVVPQEGGVEKVRGGSEPRICVAVHSEGRVSEIDRFTTVLETLYGQPVSDGLRVGVAVVMRPTRELHCVRAERVLVDNIHHQRVLELP